MDITLLVIAAILTIVGVVGNIVPVLPGTPLNFIALVVLHFVKGGDVFGTAFFIIFGALTAISLAVDYFLPLVGARLHGVSRWGIGGSVVGMLVGLIFLSLPGMVLGMFLGAVVGEIIARKKAHQALKAGLATFVGSLAALVFKLGASMVMAVYFFANLF